MLSGADRTVRSSSDGSNAARGSSSSGRRRFAHSRSLGSAVRSRSRSLDFAARSRSAVRAFGSNRDGDNSYTWFLSSVFRPYKRTVYCSICAARIGVTHYVSAGGKRGELFVKTSVQ